jgi:hypothetical protein
LEGPSAEGGIAWCPCETLFEIGYARLEGGDQPRLGLDLIMQLGCLGLLLLGHELQRGNLMSQLLIGGLVIERGDRRSAFPTTCARNSQLADGVRT